MKKALAGVLVACGMVMLTGCAVAKSLDFDSEEAAQNALDTASAVRFDGDDIKEANQTGNIYADGKVAGFLQEKGFLNSQIIISMNDNTWMYQKIVEDEPSSEELPGEELYQELLAEDRAREEAQAAEAAAKVASAQAAAGVLADDAEVAEADVDAAEE